MPTSASNIIVKNGTKNTVVSADDVNIDGTSVISALSSKQDVLTPGTGIDITNNVISSTVNSAQWGNITGTISNQTDLQTVLNAKQDTLVSGTNIKTVNGTSLLGAGDVSIDITPDNLSITKDSNDHLQAVGTVNKNTVTSSTNPVYDWVGTLQEYNDQNIETLHPDWICYITDDVQGGTSVYTKNEVNELLDVKANTDLDNLSSNGQAILDAKQDITTAVNYNNVTNCITEIPQDIKLELNNGTLTLKAGSKIYVPNGVGVFDEITITSDISVTTSTTGTGSSFLYYTNNSLSILTTTADSKPYNYSGASAPSSFLSGLAYWYDTSNNLIKYTSNSGSSWTSGYSLPLGIISYGSSAFTSIDQVFNSFGYIGSTVFTLPGVKGLIPNGRNADGTLKNIEFTIDKVVTRTITWNCYNGQDLFIGKYTQNGEIEFSSTGVIGNFYQQENKPSSAVYLMWYKPSENKMYRCDEDSNGNLYWHNVLFCPIGEWFTSSESPYPITKLKTKTAFHTVDRNDSSWLSGLGMPSNRYIDLTLGASGSTYTAPANGYFCVSKLSTGAQYLAIRSGSNGMGIEHRVNNKGQGLETYMSVKKGEIYNIYYDAGGKTNKFRFIYAEGEN